MSEQENKLQPADVSFIEKLANQLAVTANAKNIYGEPVERDGVTVIPVARAAYGFGGGGGKREKEQGEGGGGGLKLTPVGYIEIKSGETRFRPIRGSLFYAALAAPVAAFAVWQLVKIFGKSSKN